MRNLYNKLQGYKSYYAYNFVNVYISQNTAIGNEKKCLNQVFIDKNGLIFGEFLEYIEKGFNHKWKKI